MKQGPSLVGLGREDITLIECLLYASHGLPVSSQQLFRGGIVALIFANGKTKAFKD